MQCKYVFLYFWCWFLVITINIIIIRLFVYFQLFFFVGNMAKFVSEELCHKGDLPNELDGVLVSIQAYLFIYLLRWVTLCKHFFFGSDQFIAIFFPVRRFSACTSSSFLFNNSIHISLSFHKTYVTVDFVIPKLSERTLSFIYK